MRITLRQIEVFAAIARHQNVSRAADELAMSQSAASSALVELERQFDTPLFDRIGKSLKLNSSGQGLRALAEGLLAQAEHIESYLGGNPLGPLKVGATLTIGNYLATLIVADYLRSAPNAQIALHVANTREIVQQILECSLDVALIEGEASDPDLLLTPWLADHLVVFCHPKHPLAGRGAIGNTELARQGWIVREAGSGTRALTDRQIFDQIPEARILLQLEHTEAIKRAVESGLGIGCLSRLSLREAFRRGSLVEIPTPQFDLARQFYFAQHRQRPASPSIERFLALCRQRSGQADDTDALPLPFIA